MCKTYNMGESFFLISHSATILQKDTDDTFPSQPSALPVLPPLLPCFFYIPFPVSFYPSIHLSILSVSRSPRADEMLVSNDENECGFRGESNTRRPLEQTNEGIISVQAEHLCLCITTGMCTVRHCYVILCDQCGILGHFSVSACN
uniref:Uncharacterized protein n=1 Tax=Scophthalmus maximus TaxID=52904 RepID=A0A8D3CL89_SCOMX